MIIQNGTIEFKLKHPVGVDAATGHPVAPKSSWSCPVPCQYLPVSHNKQAVASGEHYTKETYTVLVEEQYYCQCGERIRLKSLCGRVMGEYSIVSVEWLEAVCETRITI